MRKSAIIAAMVLFGYLIMGIVEADARNLSRGELRYHRHLVAKERARENRWKRDHPAPPVTYNSNTTIIKVPVPAPRPATIILVQPPTPRVILPPEPREDHYGAMDLN